MRWMFGIFCDGFMRSKSVGSSFISVLLTWGSLAISGWSMFLAEGSCSRNLDSRGVEDSYFNAHTVC